MTVQTNPAVSVCPGEDRTAGSRAQETWRILPIIMIGEKVDCAPARWMLAQLDASDMAMANAVRVFVAASGVPETEKVAQGYGHGRDVRNGIILIARELGEDEGLSLFTEDGETDSERTANIDALGFQVFAAVMQGFCNAGDRPASLFAGYDGSSPEFADLARQALKLLGIAGAEELPANGGFDPELFQFVEQMYGRAFAGTE